VSDLDYAWEKFHLGLDSMATGEGNLRERPKNAYTSQVNRAADWSGARLDTELGEKVKRFHARMRRVDTPPEGQGVYSASIDAMSDEEVRAAAEELFSIALRLHGLFTLKHRANGRHGRPCRAPEALPSYPRTAINYPRSLSSAEWSRPCSAWCRSWCETASNSVAKVD